MVENECSIWAQNWGLHSFYRGWPSSFDLVVKVEAHAMSPNEANCNINNSNSVTFGFDHVHAFKFNCLYHPFYESHCPSQNYGKQSKKKKDMISL